MPGRSSYPNRNDYAGCDDGQLHDGENWTRLLAYGIGLMNQDLLLQNEYLAAENRILRAHLPTRLRSLIRRGPR